MPALKEFANFITLNTANLAETYAQLLEDNGGGYELIPKNRRVSSARKLLKAVTESYESGTSKPLARLFDPQAGVEFSRWPQDVIPPQPSLEVECLGQTMAPVVTNLESSKFLWQLLSEVRLIAAQVTPPVVTVAPVAAKVPATRPLPLTSHRDAIPLSIEPTPQKGQPAAPELGTGRRMQDLLITASEAVMLLDEKGFIDCNNATLEIFGYASKAQFINTHPSKQSPPQQPDGQDSWTAANERIGTAYREGFNRFEWLHCRADGTPFPAEVILTAVELDGKQILQAIVRDITRYKQSEQALQESENWLKTIMDSVQAGIVIIDAETRQIVDANPAALQKIGTSREKVIGSVCHKFICPAEKDRCPVCDLGQTVDNSERVLLTAAGETMPIIKNVVTVTLKDRRYLVESFVDISEQKGAEEDLLKFKLGMERSSDAFFLTATDGTIVFANAAFEKIYGYSPEEVMGKVTPRILKSGIISQDQYKYFWGTLLAGQTVAGQIINKTKDGRLVNIEGNNNPILNQGGDIIGFLSIHRDVTDRVETEQTLSKRAHELETVAEVGTVISTIFNTQQLLQTVVNLTKQRFGLYHAHIYLLDQADDTLKLAAGAGDVGQKMVDEGWQISLHKEQSLVARAARTEMGFFVNNVQEESGWLPNPDLPATRSELAVPLVAGGKVLGVLDVQADRVGYFHDEDLHIQTILAAQVAVAIQNAEQHQKTNVALVETEVLAREQTVLYELGQALTARLSVGQVLEEAYRQASRLIDTSNFYIGLYDEERQEIAFPFLVSDSEVDQEIKVIPAAQGIAGYIVHHKTSLLFEDNVQAQQEAIGIKMVGQEPQSWLGVPLMLGDRVLGVMAVQSFTSPRLYDEHSREVLTAIGSQVTIALQNATLFESMVQAQVEAEERLRETQILQKFTQTLSATMEVNGVINAFFEASIELLGVDYAIFSLVDKTQQRVKAISGFNVTDEHLRRANHPLDSDDIMADIIRRGETELITGWDDRFDVDTFTSEGMEEWGLKIFAPIDIRQENVGLVEVGFRKKVEATVQETQVELLRTLIDQAAIALESVQRYEASQKVARREQTIRQITEKMRMATNIEELIQTTAKELGQQLNAGHVVLDLGLTTDEKI